MPQLDISTEEVTVEAMMERVRDKLAESRGTVALSELFAVYTTRRALITLFLAGKVACEDSLCDIV